MSDVPSGAPVMAESGQLVYMGRICADNGVSDRSVRTWIARGLFPAPDTNLHGRNCWRLETYRQSQRDLMAGKFSKQRGSIPTREPSAA
jgi:hypothetical protein